MTFTYVFSVLFDTDEGFISFASFSQKNYVAALITNNFHNIYFPEMKNCVAGGVVINSFGTGSEKRGYHFSPFYEI